VRQRQQLKSLREVSAETAVSSDDEQPDDQRLKKECGVEKQQAEQNK
jgi:hypothetical protein